jgi:hypothetical protein
MTVDFNSGARSGRDSGKSVLDYSRNFPQHLDLLMHRNPDVMVEAGFCDLSGGIAKNMKLKNNEVCDENQTELEFIDVDGSEPVLAHEQFEIFFAWCVAHKPDMATLIRNTVDDYRNGCADKLVAELHQAVQDADRLLETKGDDHVHDRSAEG